MATQPMLTEPTTGTTNGRSRRRKSSRCCVSDCCDAFVVWLTEPLMQDMPPPPIRITIPAGVKPGGAVFVRQASTGANYLVSVPESLLPVRTPPPHRQRLITFPPLPRARAAGRHLLLRAADAARGARAVDAARHRARLPAERRLRTPGAPEQRLMIRQPCSQRLMCACNAPAIARATVRL